MRGSTGTLYGHVLGMGKPSIILDEGEGLGVGVSYESATSSLCVRSVVCRGVSG